MDRYAQAHKTPTPTVSLSADGGHHGSHCYDEDGLLICGWPNEHNQYLNGYNLRERGQRYVDTEKLIGEE